MVCSSFLHLTYARLMGRVVNETEWLPLTCIECYLPSDFNPEVVSGSEGAILLALEAMHAHGEFVPDLVLADFEEKHFE